VKTSGALVRLKKSDACLQLVLAARGKRSCSGVKEGLLRSTSHFLVYKSASLIIAVSHRIGFANALVPQPLCIDEFLAIEHGLIKGLELFVVNK